MFCKLKMPVVLLLTLALSHALVPWIHQHDGLGEQQLVSHLRCYHPDSTDSELPKGWHLHLFCFEMWAGDDITKNTVSRSMEAVCFRYRDPTLDNSLWPTGTVSATTLRERESQRSFDSPRPTRVGGMFQLCKIYKQLNVLLI